MMGTELTQQQTAKLVLLGEMGSGKSSLVLRYVKGQFFDYQVWFYLLGATYCSQEPHCVGRAFEVALLPVARAGVDCWSCIFNKNDTGAQCEV